MATSTTKKRRTAAQLAADGFAAIVEKLGMAEAIRYVQLYQHGAGNYASERHEWLDTMSHDRIAKRLAGTRKKSPDQQTRRKTQKS